MGIEIMEELPELDAMVVPVGGAGLIAGVATAVETSASASELRVPADA